jgi:hypothetical protein
VVNNPKYYQQSTRAASGQYLVQVETTLHTSGPFHSGDNNVSGQATKSSTGNSSDDDRNDTGNSGDVDNENGTGKSSDDDNMAMVVVVKQMTVVGLDSRHSMHLEMKSKNLRAYWSGLTVEISAPAPCLTVFAA